MNFSSTANNEIDPSWLEIVHKNNPKKRPRYFNNYKSFDYKSIPFDNPVSYSWQNLIYQNNPYGNEK